MRTPLPAPTARRVPYGALIGTVAILYFAKEVLIPLVLAVLFSFLLAPVVRRLEHIRFGRVPAVLTVALLFFGLFGVFGYVTVHQLNELATKLPSYQENIQHKLKSLRGHGGSLKAAERVLANIQAKAIDTPEATPSPEGSGAAAASKSLLGVPTDEKSPVPVRVVEPPASPPQFLSKTFGPLLGPLGTAFVVIIFTIFILIQREDLRDRLLHLVGPERLPVTTQAVNEAGQRVGKYLLMQAAVNVCFGSLVALGLFCIGVPAAALWGLLSAVFRFVPYVGAPLSAIGPLALAMGAFEPSWPVLATAGLFVVLELVTANAAEPLLYGNSAGLSPVAVLVSATFWTWLWGGVGLLLSTPLTVCIVVLGRYVPQLAFVHTMLGDEPVLPQDARLYQRLLAGDQEEVSEVVDEYLAEHPLAEFYDAVLIPALNQAQSDARQGSLAEDRQDFIRQTAHTLVDDLRDRPPTTLVPKEAADALVENQSGEMDEMPALPPASAEALEPRVLIVPVKTELDEVAGHMFGHLLALGKVGSEVLSAKALANEALDAAERSKAEVVCLSALRPFQVMQARYLAKRFRARFPDVKILIGLWDSKRPSVGAHRNLENIHADWVVETLGAALSEVCPVVHCKDSPALEPTKEAAVQGAKNIPPATAA